MMKKPPMSGGMSHSSAYNAPPKKAIKMTPNRRTRINTAPKKAIQKKQQNFLKSKGIPDYGENML